MELLIAAVLTLLFIGWLVWGFSAQKSSSNYNENEPPLNKKLTNLKNGKLTFKKFLNGREGLFFHYITDFLYGKIPDENKNALHHIHVFPQVSFSAVFDAVKEDRNSWLAYQSIRELRPDFMFYDMLSRKIFMIVEISGPSDFTKNLEVKRELAKMYDIDFMHLKIPDPTKWSGSLMKSDIAKDGILSIQKVLLERTK